jgi:hypothetical protein
MEGFLMFTIFSYFLIGWATIWIVDYVSRYQGNAALSVDDDGFMLFIVTLWPTVLFVIICYLFYSTVRYLVKQFTKLKVAK